MIHHDLMYLILSYTIFYLIGLQFHYPRYIRHQGSHIGGEDFEKHRRAEYRIIPAVLRIWCSSKIPNAGYTFAIFITPRVPLCPMQRTPYSVWMCLIWTSQAWA